MKAGQVECVLARSPHRLVVAGVGMPHHAGAGIGRQHPLEPLGRIGAAVGEDDHAGVDRVADPDAAAVFSSAFRIGQSAIASEPSRIASVSRYGDATEPESR